MAKQLNVNLAFTADTSQAMQTLQSLKQNLQTISSIDITPKGISTELKNAVASAQALSQHLNNAFNVKTGNLDLKMLDASLKSSNSSLATLSSNLLGAGITGEKAFLQIHSSVASANTQLIKSNGLIANFLTTLKNTARWQISSTILHGFMSSVQQAYGYAQDLNESLNNIRIVTGLNSNEMAKFAAEANKAAKALSTTTTQYTNASLIYFQQGLKEEDVKARTDITIKMANAAGQSVETVSNQLTAVWNNFAKTGDNLEYYADVMTALGAATASSTDEIAGGLEKFAAVADTIGLSYEYAASALATITANTRQSEEVVGTALKTIFARIQGLNLGETLDDGTTLNKYSEALNKVGISIFDSAGQLKKMDDILDEMGSKWQLINKDQQVALAQTVAGVRQYNQLISLMDNWSGTDSDNMQANLQTSYNSAGTLQKQADIYAESWDAASKRVKASLEAIYKELVPDNTFIGLLDGLASVLEMVEAVVKSFGGLEGIVLMISSVLLTKFTPAIGQSLQTGIDKLMNFKTAFKDFGKYIGTSVSAAVQGVSGLGSANKVIKQTNGDNSQQATAQTMNTSGFDKLSAAAAKAQTHIQGSTQEIERQQTLSLQQAAAVERTTNAFQQQVKVLKDTTALTTTIKNNSKLFTDETSKQLLEQVEQVRVLGEKKALLYEELEILQQKNSNLMDDAAESLYMDSPDASGFELAGDGVGGSFTQTMQTNLQSLGEMSGLTQSIAINLDTATGEMTLLDQNTGAVNEDFANLETLITSSVGQITSVTSVTDQLKNINLDESFGTAADKAATMQRVLDKSTGISKTLRDQIQSAINALKNGDTKKFNSILNKSSAEAKSLAKSLGVSEDHIKRAAALGRDQADNIRKTANANNEYNTSLKSTISNIQQALTNASQLGPIIAQGLSNFSSVAMSISTVTNAFNTLTDSSASFSEKLTSTAMAAAMGFRSFMIIIQGVNTVLTALNSTQAISNALNAASLVLSGQMTAAEAEETLAMIAQEAVVHKLNESEVAEMLTEGLGMSSKKANAMARLIVAGAAKTEEGAVTGASAATAADTVVTNAGTTANIAYAASQWLAYWPMLLIVAAIAAIVAITVALINARKQEIETNKQVAETAQKNADAAKEEADANNELVKSYQSALKTFQETGENKEELLKISLEVADAYGIEGAAVDALAGNYANLTKKIIAKRKAELEKTKGEQKNAVTATNTAFGDALREGDGRLTGGGSYTGLFDNGWDNSDEQVAYKALQNGKYNYLSQENGEIRFNVDDISDPVAMYAYYTELEQWITEMQTLATNNDSINLGASEIYQDAVAELKEGREYYDQLKTYMSDMQDTNMELAAYSTTLSDGQGVLDIDSLEEYSAFEEQYLKNYKEMLKADGIVENSDQWNELIDSAKEYLGIFENLSDVKVEQRAFDEITNENNEEEIKKLKEYYETLTPEEQARFWTLGIDENSSLDSVKEYMDYAQEYLNSNHLTASIKVQNDAITAFKSGDFEKLKELYNGEDSPYKGITPWEDFLKLSTDEMEDFLNSDLGLINKGIDATQAAIDKNKTDSANKKAEMDNAEAAKNTAYTNWQNAETVFAGYTKPVGSAYNYKPDELYAEHRLDYSTFETTNSDAKRAGIKYTDESTLLGLIDMVQKNSNVDTLNLLPTLEALLAQVQNGEILDADDIAPLVNTIAPTIAQLNGANEQTVKQIIEGNFLGYGDATDNHYMDFISNVFEAFTATPEYKDYVDKYNTAESNANNTEAIYNNASSTYENKKTAYETSAVDDSENLLIQSHQLNLAHREAVEGEGIDYEEFDAYRKLLTQTLEDQNPELEKLYENVTDYQQAINDIALANKKLEKGAKSLSSNWDDWNEVMTDSSSSMEDVSAILPDINVALQDVLNLDTAEFSLLPPDFAQKNWSLITDVVNGVEGAVDELRNKAGEEILLNVGVGVDDNLDGQLDTLFADLHNKIAQYDNSKFTVGIEIDPASNAEFFTACNEIVNKAGMTAAQAETYFASMGYDAEVEEVTVPPDVHPWAIENPILDEAATALAGVPVFSGTETIEGENLNGGGTALAVKTITPNGSYGGGVGVNTTTPSGATKQSSGGGNTSEPKTTHKSDVVERYKEVNDSLENVADAIEDANREADKLWGPNRIKQMQKVQSEMKNEVKLLKQKKEEAEGYLEEDRQNLLDVAAENGAGEFKFDKETGDITNYTAVMNDLYNELKAAEDSANADGKVEQDEQDIIDAVQDRIDKVQEALDLYEETKDEVDEIDNDIADKLLEIQEQNFDILNYELEVKVVVDDTQLKELDYYLNKSSDDIWGMAEAAALMVGNLNNLDTDNPILSNFDSDISQMDTWLGGLTDYQEQYNKLLEQYTTINPDTGEAYINQSQFIEGIQDLQEKIYENLDNINQMDDTMMSYYGDTLAAASEELSKFTDLMDHHVEVLDHYTSLLSIMGKSKDYERMKLLQQTTVDVTKNNAEVSKANYEMLAAEAKAKEEAWAAAQADASLTDYQKDVIKQQWLDAQNAANDAQNQMLEDAQAWAEALKTLLETELDELADNLETALAGDFGSLDYMMTSMERANSLQEEYLTTTNKIYETNKLMRTAQQEIDKTSNTVAKRKMAEFINETQQLQNKNKLSQYELDIQQAKYDLLMAEIALEEAQDAKSVVRLQRDAEGNFGYVYTADENQVADAEQQLADAQNSLYNIGLEGANRYAEQYAQTVQEMNDAVRELTQQWMDGEIASKEEYQAKMLDLENYYGEKLSQFSELHSIAVQTDSRVANEAWTRDFSHMTTQTGTWMTQVSGYADKVGQAFDKYQEGIADVEELAGADLDSLKIKTKDIKDQNDALKTSITDPDDGLLKAMQDEIDKVDALTLSYANWRKEIQGAIDDAEALAKTIRENIENESDDDESNDLKPTNPEDKDKDKDEDKDKEKEEPKEITEGSLVSAAGAQIYDYAGDTSGEHQYFSDDPKYKVLQKKNGWVQVRYHKLSKGVTGWFKESDLTALDTGGYTGAWGKEGRLAVLHEKELVLNKEDTANLLKTIEMLKSAYDGGRVARDDSALFDLLRTSHGDLTALYEQELLALNRDMNALAERNLINSANSYDKMIAAYEDSLFKLQDEMAIGFNEMHSAYEDIATAYEKEMYAMREVSAAKAERASEAYDSLMRDYSDAMLKINTEMYDQLDETQASHMALIKEYEDKLNNIHEQSIRQLENKLEDNQKGAYGKMTSIYEQEASSKIEQELIELEHQIEQRMNYESLMDEIIKSIELQSVNAQLGGMLNSPMVGTGIMKEELQQKVEISASFPNVENRSEIEEAFKDLINQASQYANRY